MDILVQMNRIVNLLFCIFLVSCTAEVTPISTARSLSEQSIPISTSTAVEITNYQLPVPQPSRTSRPTPIGLPTLTATATFLPGVTPTVSDDWKSLPVIPVVDSSVRELYEYGQTLGNDPYAFSIFGDCQSRPEEFFGVLETDPDFVSTLSPELQEAVANFQGSFNRESPTSKDGTTPGSLLWAAWHQGEFTCSFAETPVECELRIHRPSFVIIQVGTHFESRNTEYLRRIILQLMDAGVVPILATKADNREKDERINRDMSMLAAEYDLPLWNFWAAVSDLPERGLYTREDRPLQGPIYLTEEATAIHRMTGLEALNAVWRVATNP
jgi:hypothetical protein